MNTNKLTYGYTPREYKKFREYAWKMLISFGMTYLFFYNGRQNINLVMTQMAEELGSSTAAIGVVSSSPQATRDRVIVISTKSAKNISLFFSW